MIKQSTIDLIKKHEGCRLQAYQDSVGIWTIGYGSITYANGFKVSQGDKITQTEAADLLTGNLTEKFNLIRRSLKVILNQNQWDAILSLTYNIGVNAFLQSTLLKRINGDPKDPAIRPAFLMWNKARINGELKVLPGLTNRRNDEADLYFKPI